MSFDPGIMHLTRTKLHTITGWEAAHPRRKQPTEVMTRRGLSPLELEDTLVNVASLSTAVTRFRRT